MNKSTLFLLLLSISAYLNMSMALMAYSQSATPYERCDTAWATSATKFSTGWGSYATLTRTSPKTSGSITAGQLFSIGTYTMELLSNGEVKFNFALTDPQWIIGRDLTSTTGTVAFYAGQAIPKASPGLFPLKPVRTSITRSGSYIFSTGCTSPNCGTVYSVIHFEVCKS